MSSPLSSVTHIVTVMFENRSFDNLLGALYPPGHQANGLTFDGVALSESPSETIPWTEPLLVGGEPNWTAEVITRPNPDPGERVENVNLELYGKTFDPKAPGTLPSTAPMSGFVEDYVLAKATGNIKSGGLSWPKLPRERYWSPVSDPGVGAPAMGQDIMHCFRPEQLPVISGLARQYAVCDQWYAAVPTQTYPNRMFAHAATSWAEKLGKWSEGLNTGEMLEIHSRVNSVFQALDGAVGSSNGVPAWKNYYSSYSISKQLLRYLVEHDDQVVDFDRNFATDVTSDQLPPYSFVEPRYDAGDDLKRNNPNAYHPPYSVLEGEQFLQSVYETLFGPGNPRRDTTLLIVTFDEHGGCWDHHPPPAAPLPSAGEYEAPHHHKVPANPSGPPFDRYGVRVPTLLISSQIAPGTIFRASKVVSPTVTAHLDHTSIVRSVLDRFAGGATLTNRDANAPSVEKVLTEAVGANQGVSFNLNWPAPIDYHADEKKKLEEQNLLAQMRVAASS